MSEHQRPSLLNAIARGVRERCPACGEGRLFWRYLKVTPACESCGHELARHPADDGPAYLTIVLVGHLVVAPLLLFPFIWEASPWIVLPATLVPLALITLALLPRVKGGFIGVLYKLDLKDTDAHLQPADICKGR